MSMLHIDYLLSKFSFLPILYVVVVIPESSRTLNDVRDLITLIVFTNKNCKYVFAVIYDGVWEDILGKA